MSRPPNPASAPRRGGPLVPPAVRPPVENNPHKQSGHQNIVATPNSLNPKEAPKNNRDTRGVHETQAPGFTSQRHFEDKRNGKCESEDARKCIGK